MSIFHKKLLNGLLFSGLLFFSSISFAQYPYDQDTQNRVEAQTGETGVYVFRKHTPAVSSPTIYLDGEFLGKLKNNAALYRHLNPGRHHLKINKGFFLNNDVIFDFDVYSRQITYIQMTWGAVDGSRGVPVGNNGSMMMRNRGWIFTVVEKAN